MDQFEAFFRRADLDGDGRISGAEAVGFFQGSGLSKQVLAQIWMHANQNNAGFLGRQEFYNALKLVTVAQSKRELTPDMVKAALFGPAAAKIPPPQINLAAIPAPQTNTMAATSPPQMGVAAPVHSQNFGFRGPGVPNVSMGQQPVRPYQAAPQPSQGATVPNFPRGGTMVGQTQLMSAGTAPRPPQSMPAGPNAPSPNISNDWLSGRAGGAPTGARAVSPPTPLTAPRPQTPVSLPFQPTTNDSKALVVSGNGFASETAFGGDVFSALSTTVKKEPSASTYSATSSPALPANVPVSSSNQPLTKSSSLDSLQSAFSMQPAGGQLQRAHSSFNPGQQVSAQSSSSFASSGISVGAGNSTPDNSQIPWPKMKPSDVQKYLKVFMEVDIDRDGRITGEEARNLFTSWRLPREVLKQVWDLSDQDSDSMLSLREFCFALYLMERFREGRPLPALLPRNVMFDETLLSMTSQPNATYGHAAWGPGPNPGFQQQQLMGARSMPPAAGLRPPSPASAPNADGATMFNQQRSTAPALGDSFANQLDNGEQNSANSKLQEVAEERVILDSREKIEFYRTKMQELVLYKSRCDNRLNEITERAIADKREAETLAKKYEEKYKQVAEIASKLTIEEAKFRELQERKMELHQAIVNVEQGGSTDGILQVRADRIQSDLEELLKVLTERCKKHGIDVKSAALIELPVGWQPGIQEGASVWDEEWDKFEDEGFGNELTFDAKKSSTSPNAVQGEKASPNGSLTPDSLSNNREHTFESEDAYTHSEDESARSPHGSTAGRGAPESPSQEFSDAHFGRDSEADTETHRSFDESNWGAFDNNDDVDSVWGFNTKGSDSDKHGDFFGSSNYDLNPVRTESPSAGSTFRKKSPFFDDSVPSTPLSRFGNSPTRFSEVSTDQFDNFSRFDSFNMHDTGFSSQPERLTRFDSMSSTNDYGFGGPERLTRFDSMNSTSDFGGPDKLSRFDSISSSKDFGNSSSFYSFDDSDPFGSSGPFKVSSDSNSKEKF